MGTGTKEMIKSPIERGRKGAITRWGRHVVAAGDFELGNIKVDCYILKNKTRVLSLASMVKVLDIKQGGYPTGDNRIERIVNGKGISQFVDSELASDVKKSLKITSEDGATMYAYPAILLPRICNAILDARDAGILQKQQLPMAIRADIIVRALSVVGIIALVDEATGYQYKRHKDALADYLNMYLTGELAQWVKTFPDEYYEHLFRLHNIDPKGNIHKRPAYFGQITNDIVYNRLDPLVLRELQKRNPTKNGKRKHKHFQHLTKNFGQIELKMLLNRLVGYMTMADTWEEVIEVINKKHPIKQSLELMEDSVE